MDKADYYNHLEKIIALHQQSERGKLIFFQQILIVSSALLGVLVSLHTTNPPIPHIHWVFLAALVSLSIGILATGVVVYNRTTTLHRGVKAYLDELHTAQQMSREVGWVSVDMQKGTLVFQVIALFLLALGILLLTLYAILNVICAGGQSLLLLILP